MSRSQSEKIDGFFPPPPKKNKNLFALLPRGQNREKIVNRTYSQTAQSSSYKQVFLYLRWRRVLGTESSRLLARVRSLRPAAVGIKLSSVNLVTPLETRDT